MWIWIAVSRLTRRILAIEVGARGKKTLKRLWARLSHLKPFAVATDKWKVYRQIIPSSLLLQTKALTTTIESVNGQVRNYLARFNRKTKRYSKSPLMAELALYILWKQKLS
ncbi:MAG: IS1 family transposase [Alphaproteobacteria bacterium]